jgi:phosphodiesterase/alkaline phosphatase D-like protein
MMRAHRAIRAGLATLGLGVAGLAIQAGVAHGAPSEPSLLNVSTSAVRQTSATLNATIGTGEGDTTYHFEYGQSAAYGTSVPVPDADIGTGPGAVVVGREITNLQPGATYHYRVIATNALGRVRSGDQTFTTPPPQPPVVSTGQKPGEVAQNTATLTGTIDTQGFETVYEFDLGTDTSYGTRIFGDAGVEPGAHTFTVSLQGLTPGATYHYRIAATNIFGPTYGADQTLTTATYPSAVLTAPVPPPLVPALLLAPAPSTSSAGAASVKPAALTAARRHGGPRKSGGRRPRHRRNGRSHGAGLAPSANRGGGRW